MELEQADAVLIGAPMYNFSMAQHNPAMSGLIPLSEASRAKALDDAAVKAKSLAERLAA